MFLTDEDWDEWGEKVSTKVNDDMPSSYRGYTPPCHQWISVQSRTEFFGHFHAWNEGPAEVKASFQQFRQQPVWGRAYESVLYIIQHGTLFYDPSGWFAKEVERISSWCPAIRLARVFGEVQLVWHYGQYGLMSRLQHRDEPIVVTMTKANFIEAVMRFYFAIDKSFAPYYKWLPFEFRKRERYRAIHEDLMELNAITDVKEMYPVVERVCNDVHERLVVEGLAAEEGKGFHGQLYADFGHVLQLANKEIESVRDVPDIETAVFPDPPEATVRDWYEKIPRGSRRGSAGNIHQP
jgi:hypothetical protein